MEIFLIISGLIILAMFAKGDYLIAFVLLLTIGGGVTALFVWLNWSDKKYQEEKKQEEELRRLQEMQEEAHLAISDSISGSSRYFKALHTHHRLATEALDRAEGYFNDGVYSPFWDEVEKAALALGHFSENVADLSNALKGYSRWVAIYDGTPDPFPVTSEEFAKLPQLNALTNRMKSIVYIAQQDYHFASIFEQRKTQKLLVAGFESFADVLNDVGDQIDNHLGDLNTTVQSYNEEMISLMESASTQRDRHHEELMETINEDSNK